MKKFKDIRLADPFLTPHWRHARVLQMLASVPPERCRRYDDQWIRGYKQFLCIWKSGESRRNDLMHEHPGLFFAHRMFHGGIQVDPNVRFLIEARLLSGASYEDIANSCKTLPETIEWYERLYFNVSDFLEHKDWILHQVLLPASERFSDAMAGAGDSSGEYPTSDANTTLLVPVTRVPVQPIVKPHFDMSLKFFAYYGGPIVCDIMISGFNSNRKVHSPDDLADYFNEQFSMQIKRRSAQAAGRFEINKYNVTELFHIHSKLIEVQKATDPQSRRSEFEKHVNAMMTEIPWTTGRQSRELYAGTAIDETDRLPAEMNAEELLLMGAGITPESLDEVRDLKISSRVPIPRKGAGE